MSEYECGFSYSNSEVVALSDPDLRLETYLPVAKPSYMKVVKARVTHPCTLLTGCTNHQFESLMASESQRETYAASLSLVDYEFVPHRSAFAASLGVADWNSPKQTIIPTKTHVLNSFGIIWEPMKNMEGLLKMLVKI